MAELTGRRRFAHLFRRAGFGAKESTLTASLAAHPNEDTAYSIAVQKLIADARGPEGFADRIDWTPSNMTVQLWWLERMIRTTRPLREKLTLFWHDHFATSFKKDGMNHIMLFYQIELLRSGALDYLELLVRAISRNPAMIMWLDLNTNKAGDPNENFARELMELFTMGITFSSSANYSENDIREATRAFTGYTIDASGNYFFNTAQHDGGSKTVLGQACESGDDVIRRIFQMTRNGKSIVAHHIAAKLFSFLAYPVTPDDAVIAPHATAFLNSGFLTSSLVESILMSPEFSSLRAYRALVKSPVESAVSALHILGAERVPLHGVWSGCTAAGQQLIAPPDVGGWPSGRAWINPNTMLSRCNMNVSIALSLGDPAASGAGGSSVNQLLAGLTPSQKVDRLTYLLMDSDIPASTRSTLVNYVGTLAYAEDRNMGLMNLVLALPEFQLN
ncbi:MAG: DUF1800 domain-containing protein [Chloroflexota bacterium]